MTKIGALDRSNRVACSRNSRTLLILISSRQCHTQYLTRRAWARTTPSWPVRQLDYSTSCCSILGEGSDGRKREPLCVSTRLEEYLCEGWKEAVQIPVSLDFFGIQVEILGDPPIRTRHLPVEVQPLLSCEAWQPNLERG